MTRLCPTDELLRAFDRGEASDADIDSVVAHLGGCPGCTARLAAARPDPVVAALRAAAPAPPADSAYRLAVERVTGQPGAAAGRPLGPGDRLGEYELLDRLGQGGMGTVYAAVHTRLERKVAVKVLRRGRWDDPAAVARFEREIKAVGRLRHPHIVQATDAGEAAGIAYLVMELLDGRDLARVVREDGPLAPAAAFDAVRQAAAGLAAAHAAGFVHRDVKPSNLLRTADGLVKVLDLGLATLPPAGGADRAAEADASTADGLTSGSRVIGTFDYMAPEQKRDARAVDARADVYGLGCTLWYLLTGRPPQPGAGFDGGKPPGGLTSAVWKRFLADDPGERFPTVAAAATALTPRTRTQRRVALGLLTVAIACGVAYLVSRNRPQEVAADASSGEPTGPPVGRLPMTADEAKALQKTWADHLGVPVAAAGPLGMSFALIPPGEFGLSAECRVRITKPYAVGTTEVTFGQFKAFVAATGYVTQAEANGRGGSLFDFAGHMALNPKRGTGPSSERYKARPGQVWRTPGHPEVTDAHPVAQVSWPDAVAFCDWLSRTTGDKYRLPTEAELVWAGRGGLAGDEWADATGGDPDEYVWYFANCGGQPRPVGTRKPNPFGLFDAIGNVEEWCHDFYLTTLPRGEFADWAGPAESLIVAAWVPPGRSPKDAHVLTGGPYFNWSAPLHARRVTNAAGGHIGFRVARDLK